MQSNTHACLGAECPQCAVLPVGRVTYGPYIPVPGKSLLPLTMSKAMPIPTEADRRPHTPQPDARLLTFRDSTGQIPRSWPAIVVPSTTIIMRRVSREGWGELFVHQRADNGWWGFVGGRQEVGESIEECALREAKEESGYDVILERLVCVDSDPTQYAINSYPDRVVQYCNITFGAMITGGEFALSAESRAYQWLAITGDSLQLPEPFLPAHHWRLHLCLAVMMGCGAQAR